MMSNITLAKHLNAAYVNHAALSDSRPDSLIHGWDDISLDPSLYDTSKKLYRHNVGSRYVIYGQDTTMPPNKHGDVYGAYHWIVTYDDTLVSEGVQYSVYESLHSALYVIVCHILSHKESTMATDTNRTTESRLHEDQIVQPYIPTVEKRMHDAYSMEARIDSAYRVKRTPRYSVVVRNGIDSYSTVQRTRSLSRALSLAIRISGSHMLVNALDYATDLSTLQAVIPGCIAASYNGNDLYVAVIDSNLV